MCSSSTLVRLRLPSGESPGFDSPGASSSARTPHRSARPPRHSAPSSTPSADTSMRFAARGRSAAVEARRRADKIRASSERVGEPVCVAAVGSRSRARGADVAVRARRREPGWVPPTDTRGRDGRHGHERQAPQGLRAEAGVGAPPKLVRTRRHRRSTPGGTPWKPSDGSKRSSDIAAARGWTCHAPREGARDAGVARGGGADRLASRERLAPRSTSSAPRVRCAPRSISSDRGRRSASSARRSRGLARVSVERLSTARSPLAYTSRASRRRRGEVSAAWASFVPRLAQRRAEAAAGGYLRRLKGARPSPVARFGVVQPEARRRRALPCWTRSWRATSASPRCSLMAARGGGAKRGCRVFSSQWQRYVARRGVGRAAVALADRAYRRRRARFVSRLARFGRDRARRGQPRMTRSPETRPRANASASTGRRVSRPSGAWRAAVSAARRVPAPTPFAPRRFFRTVSRRRRSESAQRLGVGARVALQGVGSRADDTTRRARRAFHASSRSAAETRDVHGVSPRRRWVLPRRRRDHRLEVVIGRRRRRSRRSAPGRKRRGSCADAAPSARECRQNRREERPSRRSYLARRDEGRDAWRFVSSDAPTRTTARAQAEVAVRRARRLDGRVPLPAVRRDVRAPGASPPRATGRAAGALAEVARRHRHARACSAPPASSPSRGTRAAPRGGGDDWRLRAAEAAPRVFPRGGRAREARGTPPRRRAAHRARLVAARRVADRGAWRLLRHAGFARRRVAVARRARAWRYAARDARSATAAASRAEAVVARAAAGRRAVDARDALLGGPRARLAARRPSVARRAGKPPRRRGSARARWRCGARASRTSPARDSPPTPPRQPRRAARAGLSVARRGGVRAACGVRGGDAAMARRRRAARPR